MCVPLGGYGSGFMIQGHSSLRSKLCGGGVKGGGGVSEKEKDSLL